MWGRLDGGATEDAIDEKVHQPVSAMGSNMGESRSMLSEPDPTSVTSERYLYPTLT